MSSALKLGVTLSAKDNLSPVLNKTIGKLDNLKQKSKAIGSFMAKAGAISLAGASVIGAAIGSTVGVYQDLAKAQGEVESLGVGAKGIKAITNEARIFSNTFSGTTQADFMRASYDIKSGISSLSDVGVAKMTSLAALTGKATKSTTTQMTSFFATGYGIYAKQFNKMSTETVAGWKNLSQEEKDIKFGEYFATGIGAAVQMFKTTGSQMQGAIENLGATATTSNVPLAEQLAILGSMQKSFASGSEAATAYKGFLAGAVKAQEKLNLKLVDQNNQLLSAPKILEKLKEKYGETLDDMEKKEIKDAMGTEEGMKFITAFYGEIDELKISIDKMGNSMGKGTSELEKMAKSMNKGNEFELLSQKTSNLMSIIGSQFAPIIIRASTILGNMADKLQIWTKSHPKLVSSITTGIVVLGGFLAVIGSLGLAISGITLLLAPLLGGFALLFLGIAAVGAAAYIFYDNWNLVRTFWTGLWTDVKNYFIDSWNGIKESFTSWNPLETIQNIWNPVSEYFKNLFSPIMEMIDKIMNNSFVNGIGDFAKEAKTSVTTAWDNTVSFFAEDATTSDNKTMGDEDINRTASDNVKPILNPITNKKTVEKNIHVEAPIQITVHAVNGKVPTKEIGATVQNAVKKAVKASSSTSYEDQE